MSKLFLQTGPYFAEKSNITSTFSENGEKLYEDILKNKMAKRSSSSFPALDSKSSLTDLQKAKLVHSTDQRIETIKSHNIGVL